MSDAPQSSSSSSASESYVADLHPLLAEASDEARARALAKAGRVVSRLRAGEELRGHTERAGEREDAELQLRRLVVRQAYDGDQSALDALAHVVGAQDDGVRLLLRALNNVRSLESEAAGTLTTALLGALHDSLDGAGYAKVLARLLPAVSSSTSAGEAVRDRAAHLLTTGEYADPSDVRTWLLQELVASDLRLDVDSDYLVRKRGSLRPPRLRDATRKRLDEAIADGETPWSRRLAAVWLVGAADTRGVEQAREALDSAWHDYPLQALASVEQVGCAVEYEAHERIDELRVADKLQILHRKAGTMIHDAERDDLVAAVLDTVRRAVSGELPHDPVALMESRGEGLDGIAAAATLDDRIRRDLFARLASTGGLAEACKAIFETPGIVDHHGALVLATAALAVICERRKDDDLESLRVAWEQLASATDGGESDTLSRLAPRIARHLDA